MRAPFRRSAPAERSTDEQRRRPHPSIFAVSVAVGVGLLALMDMLTNIESLNGVGSLLLEYGLIVAAFALILGIINVLTVHGRKVQLRDEGWPYSLVLLIVTLFLIAIGLMGGPQSAAMNWTLLNVLLPLQSTFFSLLAFFLVSVAYRSMRIDSLERFVLVASAVIVILGATPVGALLSPWLVTAKDYLLAVPATAGARGLLLGIALGTLLTGMRLIFDGRRYFK